MLISVIKEKMRYLSWVRTYNVQTDVLTRTSVIGFLDVWRNYEYRYKRANMLCRACPLFMVAQLFGINIDVSTANWSNATMILSDHEYVL